MPDHERHPRVGHPAPQNARAGCSIIQAVLPLAVLGIEMQPIDAHKPIDSSRPQPELLFKAIFERAPIGVALIDVESQAIVEANEQLAVMLHSSREALAQSTWTDLLHPADADEHACGLALLRSGENERVEVQGRCLLQDGSEVFLRLVMTSLAVPGDGSRYALFLAEDITEAARCEWDLEVERARLENVMAATSAGWWEWNVQTGAVTFNEQWATIIGYTLAELKPLSIQTWVDHTHPDDLERSNQTLEAHFAGETAMYVCEVRMRHKDGHWVWIRDRGRVVSHTPDGKPLMMYGLHLDISEYKRLQADTREVADALGLANEVAEIGSWRLVVASGSLECDARLHEWYEIPQDRNEQSRDPDTWLSRVHPEDRERVATNLEAAKRGERLFNEAYRIVRSDGELRYLVASAVLEYDDNGTPDKLIGINRDVTRQTTLEAQLRAANEELQAAVRRDVLTGLPNRMAANERLADEFARMKRTLVAYAVLIMDIDLFKNINDTHGHIVGDQALRHVSAVLQRSIRRTDFIARFGGEEFVVILPATDRPGALCAAEALRSAVESHPLPGVGTITVSIGVAMAQPDDRDEMVVIHEADSWLYQAKRAGRNRLVASPDASD